MLITFTRRARCQCFPFTVVGEWEITNFLTSKKFIKYCWLYSSISLRNQSLFPEEHFPSYAREITPLAVYSIRPTILPVTSPLYSRFFLLCYCNPFLSLTYASHEGLIVFSHSLRSFVQLRIIFFLLNKKRYKYFLYIKIYVQFLFWWKLFTNKNNQRLNAKFFQKQLL